MKVIVLSIIFLTGSLFAVPSFSACTVTATTLDFSTYDTLSTVATDSTASLSVECSSKEDILIAIGPSPNSGGFNPRQMINVQLLNYNVYTSGGRNRIWGDGTGGTEVVDKKSVTTRVINSVNGRIPPLQNVASGIYNDTLLVTVYQQSTSTVLATASMNVTVNVIPVCSITSATDVSFGVYDPLNITDNTTGAGSFTFVCGGDTSYQLYIVGTRQMSDGGGNLLNYEIFTDIARTMVWPTSTPSPEGGTAISGTPVTKNVYGRIFASQDVPAGVYSSTLSVTVTY